MNASSADEDDEERKWPAVYEAEELVATIKDAAASAPSRFFTFRITDPEASQGDVISLAAEIPVIDASGEPSTDAAVDFWLVISNSCDVSRAYEPDTDVNYVAIAPLVPLSGLRTDAEAERALREYKIGRAFYVPAWDAEGEPHVANLMQFVSIHRDALKKAAIKARLRMHSWILLNACLVRLLCRDDERYGSD